ncbi:MAG: hypothetical protein LBU32_18710 [Clostridiales bacterium]|jgi:hypothetical protein|nr:hypothetical protein [Clostridiales bacterium]
MNYRDALQELIRQKGKSIGGSAFVKGNIPEKKILNAVREFADGVSAEDVFFLLDTTVFGSAKEGLLLTDTALYMKCVAEKASGMAYDNLDYCEVEFAKNGKDTESILVIHGKSWEKVNFNTIGPAKSPLADLIESVASLYNEASGENDVPTNEYAERSIRQPERGRQADQSARRRGPERTEIRRPQYEESPRSALKPIAAYSDVVKETYIKILADFIKYMDADSQPLLREFFCILERIEAGGQLTWWAEDFFKNNERIDFEELNWNDDFRFPVTGSVLKSMIYLFSLWSKDDPADDGYLSNMSDYLHDGNFIADGSESSVTPYDQQIEFYWDLYDFDDSWISGDSSLRELKDEAGKLGLRAREIGLPIETAYLSGALYGVSQRTAARYLNYIGAGALLGLRA